MVGNLSEIMEQPQEVAASLVAPHRCATRWHRKTLLRQGHGLRRKWRTPVDLYASTRNTLVMQLLLGTHNAGKRTEMRQALSDCGCVFIEPEEVGIVDAPEETGTTFAENAVAKSRFFFEHSRLPSVSDDSGIVVEALANELGIHTRRWGAGAHATDAEWIEHFLRRMEQEENRRARFVCAIAFTDGAGGTHLFEGACDGVITPTLEAGYLSGLPISACFRPDGFTQVYSALSIELKNSTSHRGKALRGFADMLRASAILNPPA